MRIILSIRSKYNYEQTVPIIDPDKYPIDTLSCLKFTDLTRLTVISLFMVNYKTSTNSNQSSTRARIIGMFLLRPVFQITFKRS